MTIPADEEGVPVSAETAPPAPPATDKEADGATPTPVKKKKKKKKSVTNEDGTPVVKKKKKKKKVVAADGAADGAATGGEGEGDSNGDVANADGATPPVKKKKKKFKKPKSAKNISARASTMSEESEIDTDEDADLLPGDAGANEPKKTPTKSKSKRFKKKPAVDGDLGTPDHPQGQTPPSSNPMSSQRLQPNTYHGPNAPRHSPPPPPGTRRMSNKSSRFSTSDNGSSHRRPVSLMNMAGGGGNSSRHGRTVGGPINSQQPPPQDQQPQSMRMMGGRAPMMGRGGRGRMGPGGRGRGRSGAQSMMNMNYNYNQPPNGNPNLPDQPPYPKRPASILRSSSHARPSMRQMPGEAEGGRGSPTAMVNPDGSITTGNAPTRMGANNGSLHGASGHHPIAGTGASTRYMSQSIRPKKNKDPPRPGLMAGLSGLDMSSHHVRSSPEGARILDMSNHSLENNSNHRRSLMMANNSNPSNRSMRSMMSLDLGFDNDPSWKQFLRYIRLLPPHREEKPLKRRVRIMTWLALLCDLTAAIVSVTTYNEVTTCCGVPVLNIAAENVDWDVAIRVSTYVYICFIFLEIVPVVREGFPFNLLNPLIGFLITFAVFFDDGILEAAVMWIIEATAVALEFLTYRCHIQQYKNRKARMKAVELDLEPFRERRRKKREQSRKNLRRSQKMLNGEPLSSSDEESSDSSDDDSATSDDEFATINDAESGSSRRAAFKRKLSKGELSALSASSSIHEGNFRDEDASGSDKDLTQVRELTLLRERRILRQRQGEDTKTLRYHFVGVCMNVGLCVMTFLLIVFIARSGGLCVRGNQPPNIFATDQLGSDRCFECKDDPMNCDETCHDDPTLDNQCYYPYTLT